MKFMSTTRIIPANNSFNVLLDIFPEKGEVPTNGHRPKKKINWTLTYSVVNSLLITIPKEYYIKTIKKQN